MSLYFLRLAKQSQFIPLQNVVYFISLRFLVRKILTFYINDVLLFKCPFPGPKGWSNYCIKWRRFSQVRPLLSTHNLCKRWLLNLITLSAIPGWNSLHEGSARYRARYLHNTHYSQETDIHATGGIQTRNPTKGATPSPSLRPRGHWDRVVFLFTWNCLRHFYSL